MNTNIRIGTLVFWGGFAVLLVVGAVAHHGNSQAPAPRWEGTTLPGAPVPRAPQGPAY
jgi:hypothetical protein